MRKINIIHLGIGNVGKEIVKQIAQNHTVIKKQWGIDVKYCGLFNSKEYHLNPKGFSKKELLDITSSFGSNALKYYDSQPLTLISRIPSPFMLIDTTASDKTYPLVLKSLQRGGFVVMSNKKNLCGSQKEFDELHTYGGSKLYYETTVGAALPIIQTLKNLLATGDEVLEINACVSGTLGYIFSQLDHGVWFSDAVKKAKEKGFTEPDPRDDLSGKDVARKALILSRIMGKRVNFEEIKVDNLYPKSMNLLSIDEFMKNIDQLNSSYLTRLTIAKEQKKRLRFVAKVNGVVKAGVESVEKDGNFGALSGPDNLFEFRTKRYNQNPLIIKGPGAGVDVTASGVVSDIFSALKSMQNRL